MPPNLEEDAQQLPAQGALREVSALVEQAENTTAKINDLEEKLKKHKQRLNQLLMTGIPDAMDEAGVSEFTTTEGRQVKIQEYVDARIPPDKQREAHDWLRNNGHEGLVRHTVTVTLPKGGDNFAHHLVEEARSNGYSAEDKEGVHASTLKAWVREQLSEGVEPPKELFTIQTGRIAKIK